MNRDKKLIRITTIPMSLNLLLPYQLRFMSQYYEVKAVAHPKGGLEDVVKREGVPVIGVPMTRAITPVKDLKALWQLYKLLKKERPYIVHTHTPKAGLLGMMAAKMAGVPVRLHTVAGLPLMEATGNKRKVLDAVERLTYACAHKVYPNSTELRNIIIQNNYCDSGKLKVIGNGSTNGIDTAAYAPETVSTQVKEALRTELELKENDVVYCFIGRIVSDKGVNEMIAAYNSIAAKHPEAKFILVGPFERELDPLSEETEKIIASHAGIKWVGYQKDVKPYLAVSDVFVFPSYREGFPNVVMQAGAMGLPCIVSNINGCNEIVEDGFNGIIIPVKDKGTLESKMQLLLEDAPLRKQMASVSRDRIVSRYRREYVWEEILKEYRSFEKA